MSRDRFNTGIEPRHNPNRHTIVAGASGANSKPMMTRSVFVCALILALVTAAAPGFAGDKEDCETRIRKLDASSAEGQERLDEKNASIDFCANQYRHDKTVGRLVEACAKYEEQPVVKQQLVAECQLAAFGYANALRTLKAEFGK
jgi:hypothetical protein